MTCDFWEENGKRKIIATVTAIESVASPLGVPLQMSLKRCWAGLWKEKHTPGAEAPHSCELERPKAEALGYLYAKNNRKGKGKDKGKSKAKTKADPPPAAKDDN